MDGFMIALTMMLPIGLSIILQMEEEFGRDDSHKFSVCLMLGIAYAASMGGMATPVGTPPNLVFQRTFELTFPKAPPVSFGIWMVMAVPLSVFMILTIWLVLTKVVYRPHAGAADYRREIRGDMAAGRGYRQFYSLSGHTRNPVEPGVCFGGARMDTGAKPRRIPGATVDLFLENFLSFMTAILE
jgi:hypothetical protein